MHKPVYNENIKFKKAERLCSPITINNLFREGKSIYKFPFRIVYKIEEQRDFLSKVVISVPKRNFKRAVKRNYFKRRIREAYRLNKHIIYKPLQEFNLSLEFIIIYNTTEKLNYKDIEAHLSITLQLLSERIIKYGTKNIIP